MLVSSFNLSQSFNYAPYLFCKKRFNSEINCFCIRTQEEYMENRQIYSLQIYSLSGCATSVIGWWGIFLVLLSRRGSSSIRLLANWVTRANWLSFYKLLTRFFLSKPNPTTEIQRLLFLLYSHNRCSGASHTKLLSFSGSLHGWRKRKGYYLDGGGPTYAARSLSQYISAFATRVLQSTFVCVEG